MILPYFIFVGQVLSFFTLVSAPWFFSSIDWLVVLFMYFIGGCLGGTVTFHRLLSHKSWDAPTWWYYVGSLCGMFFLIGSPLAWSNTHLAHHRYVDTDKDPHSPGHKGFWRVQFLSMFDTPTTMRYALRNVSPFQTFLHKHYAVLHLLYAFTLFSIGGLHLLAVVYLVPSAVIWHMASLVNTVNHLPLIGNYRNYAFGESTFNNLFTGLLVWGEGWHNNHHALPNKAKFGSEKWWELDLGYLVIKMLEKK